MFRFVTGETLRNNSENRPKTAPTSFFSKIVPTKASLKKTNEVARYLFRFYRMQQNAGVAVSRAPKTEGGRKFRFENKNKSEKKGHR